MAKKKELIKVYTGTRFNVDLLKSKLKEIGIESLVKDAFQSGMRAGFGGGTISTVYLFILDKDFAKAEPIIKEFSEE